jgi:hypothetical protein
MGKNETPGIARLGDRLGRVLLILMLFIGLSSVFQVLIPVAGSGPGRELTFEVDVSADALRDLPPNTQLAGIVPAEVTLPEPSTRQALPLVAASLPGLALVLFVIGELRMIAGTVRRGDPFIEDNVRRLRWIGFAFIVGGPLVQLGRQFFLHVAASTAGIDDTPFHIDVPGTLPLVGIGVLVLAHVFSQGVRLREDVEGTV